MSYLPFIMLLQVFLLIVTEKISFRLPRLAQNIERFYQNVVEDSLFGKDPDGTEDMRDPRTSTAGISARRHRNEICVSLKRSSIICNVYLVKKFVEIFLGYVFILLDIGFYMTIHQNEKIPCRVKIPSFPGLLDHSGRIYYQVNTIFTERRDLIINLIIFLDSQTLTTCYQLASSMTKFTHKQTKTATSWLFKPH